MPHVLGKSIAYVPSLLRNVENPFGVPVAGIEVGESAGVNVGSGGTVAVIIAVAVGVALALDAQPTPTSAHRSRIMPTVIVCIFPGVIHLVLSGAGAGFRQHPRPSREHMT